MARIIRWEPVMATGIQFMDQEHRQLIDDMTALNTAFQSRDMTAASRVFQTILNDIQSHFANEELAMLQNHYPQGDYAAHKEEHDEFLMQLRFFHKRLDKGSAMLHADILEFMSAWMTAHMLGQDRKMGHQMAVCAA